MPNSTPAENIKASLPTVGTLIVLALAAYVFLDERFDQQDRQLSVVQIRQQGFADGLQKAGDGQKDIREKLATISEGMSGFRVRVETVERRLDRRGGRRRDDD